MNYPRQMPYSNNTSYNTNNMSPITTSSVSTNGQFYSNNVVMDNDGYCNNVNQYNANDTPYFNDKGMMRSLDQAPNYSFLPNQSIEYNNCNYLPPNHNNYCCTSPSNYIPSTATSSVNASCRSSCDESMYNDINHNDIQNHWIYNERMNPDPSSINTLPNIKTESYNNNGYINTIYNPTNNDYYNPSNYHDTVNYDVTTSHVQQQQQQPPICTPYNHNNNNNAFNMDEVYYPPTNNTNNNTYTDYTHNVANNNNILSYTKSHNVYPSYKQKCVTHNTRSTVDIKQELYRHRRQELYGADASKTMNIKIKGSNFENLLSKLTRSGDITRCIECNKSFLQKCHLFRHIRDCHLIKPAIHFCPFCSKTFHQKSNLDTHCMTHAKQRKFSHPFKCIICIADGKDKSFTRKSSLKRHCTAKHKDVNVEAEWINKQQTPKWNHSLKTFVFNHKRATAPIKKK